MNEDLVVILRSIDEHLLDHLNADGEMLVERSVGSGSTRPPSSPSELGGCVDQSPSNLKDTLTLAR